MDLMFKPDIRLAHGAAGCSLWWTRTPALGSHRTGLIGEYAADDDAGASSLLSDALAQLAAHGCTIAIGPMDGSVWDRYRFVTTRGSEPPFVMEPDNPDCWPRHFTAAGFEPLARYYSALNSHVAEPGARADQLESALKHSGITIRELATDRFEAELLRLYPVAMAAFQHGYLFTPVDDQKFVRRYLQLRPGLRPELLLVAECGRLPCGFLLAMPDAARSDTFVIRTVAVAPEHAGAGLGSALVERAHTAGAACGFRRAIHALMHESNRSRRLSAHTARTIREYTLFARLL